MKFNPPSILFSAMMILFALVFLSIFEPDTKLECTSGVIVDLYPGDGPSKTMVVDIVTSVETFDVSDENYYRHAIGDEVSVCKYRKTYSRLPNGYGLEH